MRKCRNCLCRTCTNVCCDKKKCPGKKKECGGYSGFRQISIFDAPQNPRKKAPRHSWEYYGITKERYRALNVAIRSGRYAAVARQAAREASESIAEYILLSAMEKRSYEGVEYPEGLGRIPCGRTDFYGYRREFYHRLDLRLREMGI